MLLNWDVLWCELPIFRVESVFAVLYCLHYRWQFILFAVSCYGFEKDIVFNASDFILIKHTSMRTMN